MRLKFLINSLAKGGAETVLTRLAKYLPIDEIILLENDVKYDVEQKLSLLSNVSDKQNAIFKYLLIPIYGFRLSKKLKKRDIVVSFLERANFVNILSSFISKHTSIVSVRTNPLVSYSGIKKPNISLIRLLYPKADLIVAVSQDVKDSLIKIGLPSSKIKVIYNPYPVKKIADLAKEDIEKIFLESPYLITVGRLTKPKGQWYLIRIFRELKNEYPNLKLLILGEGELKEYLVKLSQDLGLKTYVWNRDVLSENFDVYFLGFQKNPFKYVARAKLFVFPSLWEGFPNALVEAMACGVPVIASDCRSGPREILAPDTDFRIETKEPEFAKYGILMPVFDGKFLDASEPLSQKEKVWIRTLKKVLDDEKLVKFYANKCILRARDFSIDNIIKEWKKILGV